MILSRLASGEVTEPSQTGGCLCGGVRFEIDRPAHGSGYCHCTRCQKRTGTGSSCSAFIDGTGLRIVAGEDLVKAWRHPDGGWEKAFCRECGAHLWSRDADDPAGVGIRMSAFDGDPGVRPTSRQYVAYAAAWDPIPDDGVERFPEGRP